MALAYDGAIQRLIDAFGRLPGIGPKGAQRIAFYMLSAPEDEARDLAEAIEEVKLRSRQYAKRQLTWLRRNPDIHWILWGEEPNFPRGLQNATEYLTALGLR